MEEGQKKVDTEGLDILDYYQSQAYVPEKKDFNPLRDLTDGSTGGLFNTDKKIVMDTMVLKNLYFSESWIFILIDRIASKIARLPIVVKKTTGDTLENQKIETLIKHPILDLLKTPNDYQDQYQLLYSWIADNCILGNGLLWYAKNLNKLTTIPGEIVTADFDPATGFFKGFFVNRYGIVDDVLGQKNRTFKVPREAIAHIKIPNPSDPFWGLSPLIPGRKEALFNRYTTEFLNNFYIKGAHPGMVLEMGSEANEKLALKLLRSFELSYNGRPNQRKNLILPKGVKATEAKISLADQQLKEFMLLNREAIINLYQVPKHELSIAESGSLGSEEYKTALKNFWNGPLKQMIEAAQHALDKVFKGSLLQEDESIEFDLSTVDILKDDEMEKAKLGAEMLKTHTLNEVRKKLYGMDALSGGDVTPNPNPQPQGFSQFSVPSQAPALPPPPGAQEPAPEEELAIVALPTTEPTEVIEIVEDSKAVLAVRNIKEKDPGWWKEREEGLDKEALPASEKVLKRTLDLFVDQAESLIKAVRSELPKKSMHLKDVNKNNLRRKIKQALSKFEEGYVNDSVNSLEATMDAGYQTSLKLPFKLPNEDQIMALGRENASARKELLEARLISSFEHMNQTTTDTTMRIIETGLKEQQTVNEIAQTIAKNYTDEANVMFRAERIARTETLTAASIGQYAALSDAATVVPDMRKVWVNAGDERVRGNPSGKSAGSEADHWQMQGQSRKHNEAFIDPRSNQKLMYPRDTTAPASHTINCRCTMIMLPKEQAGEMGFEDIQSDTEVE